MIPEEVRSIFKIFVEKWFKWLEWSALSSALLFVAFRTSGYFSVVFFFAGLLSLCLMLAYIMLYDIDELPKLFYEYHKKARKVTFYVFLIEVALFLLTFFAIITFFLSALPLKK